MLTHWSYIFLVLTHRSDGVLIDNRSAFRHLSPWWTPMHLCIFGKHELIFITMNLENILYFCFEIHRFQLSSWSSDAIWHCRTWSILSEVMACCLTAQSHYLIKCWLILSIRPLLTKLRDIWVKTITKKLFKKTHKMSAKHSPLCSDLKSMDLCKKGVTPLLTYWSYIFLALTHPTVLIYRQVSNISRTLVGNKIVDHSGVVEASPVSAAPTTGTSSFSTWHLASLHLAKTTAKRDQKHLSLGICWVLY